MSRSTLLDAKNSRIPAMLNMSPEDSRFPIMVNECIERLVKTGEKFHGLYGEFKFCVDNGCITLPRQIANVEAVAVCGQPLPIRSAWFQFLESGPGVDMYCNENHRRCGLSFNQKAGDFCAFADIISTEKKIKVYADVSEDDEAVILLQGYNGDGQWIRTEVEGEWVDGEYVVISTTPQTSVNVFSSLVAVQKPVTNGVVRLYEYDTVEDTQRALAIYEPDETRPAYRRVHIHGINDGRGCCSSDEDCTTKTVTVIAKLEFIPVSRDNDWLLIGNLSALKDEAQSVLKYECNLADEGLFWHQKAIDGLRKELRHYLGSGIVQPVRMQPRNISGPAVRNLI